MKVLVNQKGKAKEAGRSGWYLDPVLDMTDQEILDKFGLDWVVADFLKQRLVDGRAAYDRARKGNDSTPPMNQDEARKAVESRKYSRSSRPTEGLSQEEKDFKVANKVLDEMTDAQLLEVNKKLEARIAAAKARQAGAQG